MLDPTFFIVGFIFGLALYCLGVAIADRIRYWLWLRNERPLGVHFQWSDITKEKGN